MAWLDEDVSAQFARWEERGRGWKVWPYPVEPEPPFVPFAGYVSSNPQFLDDGRRPNPLTAALTKLGLLIKPSEPGSPPEPEPEPEPRPLERTNLVELQTSLSVKLDLPKEVFEQFLLNLSLCHKPIAFELLGLCQKVAVQFAAHLDDAPLVRRQLQAHFPDAVFQPARNPLAKVWEACVGDQVLAVEFGLELEFMFLLASGKLDPFIGIIGALSELQPGELGLFQVLFQPAQSNWPDSITRALTHADGKPFFVNMPELTAAAETKVARPLYAAVVRVLVRTEQHERTLRIVRDLAGSLRVFINPKGNALVPLANDEYPIGEHIADVLARQSRRSGMLLNLDELIGFVHLPSNAVRSPVLQRDLDKTKGAPAIVCQPQGLLLGENIHFGKSIPVRLTPEQRVRHTHIIGASGKGKSTLLFNLIRQDIENGEGVAVLDPHGDLVDTILTIIPPHRIGDVVLMDPADEEYSVGFNILSAHSDLEKTLLASDLVSVFRRLSTSWGDQMGSVLNNAILVFLETQRGGTLSDLRRFLIEPAYRAEVLRSVHDSELVYYWQKGFTQLSGNKSIGPIVTRLEAFLAPKPIRYVVSQPENRLDFARIMDRGQIFLAKLSEGLLGKENSHLFGTLLVAKFQQTAMSRQAQQSALRKDFWLYIDEFHNFITPSMAQILTGARKYRIGLTLAHQELRQLERDSEVASAVLSNPGTRICFGLGDDDARKLAQGFSTFDARDLQNLEIGQAICRVEKSSQDFNLTVPKSEAVDPEQGRRVSEAATVASRKTYARPRAEVEATLLARLGVEPPVAKPADGKPMPTILPKPASTKIPPVQRPAKESVLEVDLPVAAEAKTEPATPLPPTDAERISHTKIKDSIGAEAESLDYTVTYEELFPEVQGRADIVLRRGGQTIICQVTVTTQVEYEVASIHKFLQTSVTHIAVVSNNRKKLGQIREALGDTGHPSTRVGFYSPEDFISKLYDWAADDSGSGNLERRKLRKQKIALDAGPISESERKAREKWMLDEICKAMKR